MSEKSSVDFAEGMAAIRVWLRTQPHLPDDLDDRMLKRFLHSCYYDLPKTEKCIDRFFCLRRDIPQLFAGRDPMAPNFQTAFSIYNFCNYYTDDGRMVIVHQVNDPNLDKFVCNDIYKTFTTQADVWLEETNQLVDSDVIIMDLQHIPFKIITKLDVLIGRMIIVYLLEAMPIRMREVHIVNCPSFINALYALVRTVVPNHIHELVRFHTGTDTLHKHVSKQFLPEELGGTAGPMAVQMKDWVKKMERKRDLFLKDDLWLAAPKKKGKNKSAVEEVFKTEEIDRSFNNLCID